MTENTTSPPPAKALPLFTLDLADNGGHLAPTSYKELTRWIQTKQNCWSWVQQRHYLSLLEGVHLTSKEDRQLILQALFRPASDGIVKDEGVPFSLAEALTRSGKP